MPFPYIFTFYSYKGGVGRSMAVMNVAYTLAGRGRHVLVVDMDVEAPGISGFLHRSQELAEPNTAHPKDVLTLLGEAIRATETQTIPPVSNYIRSVAEDKLDSLRPELGTLGRLDVLGTDLDRDYLERLSHLGLKDLPQDRLVALSRVLHSYFKAQVFSHRPLGVESFEPAIETHYDYVLVDSRTGITEIGGLCVGPLADRLVVITGLNDQNVQGTLDFMNEAGIRPRPRSNVELWDDADRADNASLGPKPTILVVSPVPSGEIEYKRKRLGEVQQRLGLRPVSLSYHPQMALMESVFVRDYREEFLAREYEGLATNVMAQVGDDPQHLALESGVLWNEKKDLAGAVASALRLAPHDPKLGVGWLGLLGEVGELATGIRIPEMRQLYASLSLNAAIRPAALNNWGVELAGQAKIKAGEEADQLFEEAGSKYAEATRLKPDYHVALFNWGNALGEQAKTKGGEEAERLFAEACRKYAEATRLKPDYHAALFNWGLALAERAKVRAGDERDRFVEEACRKYADAHRLKPDFPETLVSWGAALSMQAKTKAGREAGRLFEAAGSKYAEAIRLRPDFHEALNSWGAALVNQASMNTGKAASQLLQRARNMFLKAEAILPGSSAYNIACARALEGITKEAVHWLQKASSADMPLSRAKIAAEKDFDRIRNDPEFAHFVESLPEV
jgi:cytochrome c-type biogenesis protein CcmH/NrfG